MIFPRSGSLLSYACVLTWLTWLMPLDSLWNKGPQQHPSSELDSGWSSLARPMLFRRPLSRHRCFSAKSAWGDRPYAYRVLMFQVPILVLVLAVRRVVGTPASVSLLVSSNSWFSMWQRSLYSEYTCISIWSLLSIKKIIIITINLLKGAFWEFHSFLVAQWTVSHTAQTARAQLWASHAQHIERLSCATCRVLRVQWTAQLLGLTELASHLF